MHLEIAKFDVVPIVIWYRITEALVLRNGQINEILTGISKTFTRQTMPYKTRLFLYK